MSRPAAARPSAGYRFLEDVAIADIAVEAWGRSLGELFAAAARATLAAMVDPPEAVSPRQRRRVEMRAGDLELLLLDFLQELIYLKDAEAVLLRPKAVRVEPDGEGYRLTAALHGEAIAPERHPLVVDVKAVTAHRLWVGRDGDGWRAEFVLDA